MRYDTVFLDIDGTLLWVDVDVEGYVADLAPYSWNGLSAEDARGPVWKGMRRHIKNNINYRTEDDLADFKRETAAETARDLQIHAPPELLRRTIDQRVLFKPFKESERVLDELRSIGCQMYVVSNWDILLEEVLEDLGWRGYFEGIIASAVVGVEKPEPGIFEEALRLSGRTGEREKVVHVGNDPVSDVEGAVSSGIDAVMISRSGEAAPRAVATLPDLNGVPDIVRG